MLSWCSDEYMLKSDTNINQHLIPHSLVPGLHAQFSTATSLDIRHTQQHHGEFHLRSCKPWIGKKSSRNSTGVFSLMRSKRFRPTLQIYVSRCSEPWEERPTHSINDQQDLCGGTGGRHWVTDIWTWIRFKTGILLCSQTRITLLKPSSACVEGLHLNMQGVTHSNSDR